MTKLKDMLASGMPLAGVSDVKAAFPFQKKPGGKPGMVKPGMTKAPTQTGDPFGGEPEEEEFPKKPPVKMTPGQKPGQLKPELKDPQEDGLGEDEMTEEQDPTEWDEDEELGVGPEEDPMEEPELTETDKASPAAQHVANHIQDPVGSTKQVFQKLQRASQMYERAKEEARMTLAPAKAIIQHVSQSHGLDENQNGIPDYLEQNKPGMPGMSPAAPMVPGMPMRPSQMPQFGQTGAQMKPPMSQPGAPTDSRPGKFPPVQKQKKAPMQAGADKLQQNLNLASLKECHSCSDTKMVRGAKIRGTKALTRSLKGKKKSFSGATLTAGGPGSGCRGENCGRKGGGKGVDQTHVPKRATTGYDPRIARRSADDIDEQTSKFGIRNPDEPVQVGRGGSGVTESSRPYAGRYTGRQAALSGRDGSMAVAYHEDRARETKGMIAGQHAEAARLHRVAQNARAMGYKGARALTQKAIAQSKAAFALEEARAPKLRNSNNQLQYLRWKNDRIVRGVDQF